MAEKSNHRYAPVKQAVQADRRYFLKGSSAILGMFLASPALTAPLNQTSSLSRLRFSAVAASTADRFIVPPGYSARPLISWGDPLLAHTPDFDPSGHQNAATQAGQFGDNTDGMSLFPLSDRRALLVVNNEYTNYDYLFAHDGKVLSPADVARAQAAHGVSIFEIQRNPQGHWHYVQGAPLNRRLTARTPMVLTGPAAGHPLLQTAADPTGRAVLGTLNNCANGQTPWGTALSCEENFNGYFGSSAPLTLNRHQRRYGLGQDWYRWYSHDTRFDLARHPQEPNRFGWVVEIDPMDPTSTPKKRTALGRFKHENAALVVDKSGHVVVYMGDDERGEHLYRFVSSKRYDPASPALNRELLDEGTLYVARFEAAEGALKGSGRWLALAHGQHGLTAANGFPDQASILIYTREAATQAGATTMDRPEWVAIHPDKRSVCCSLTNNRDRGIKPDQPLNGPNPRLANPYGQILRWYPPDGDHRADHFDWDLFLLAGNPTVHDDLYAGSQHITPHNMFNSPDGITFDKAGRLWIQTDGNTSNQGDFAGMGNNQLLCADPSRGEVRRFATGPLGCELTGLAFTPDQRTLFVGVQHPGEKGQPSHFPAGGNSKPRSTIMAVQRDDGGPVGG